MSELAHLFSPIKSGNVEIRNRILQSAHITNFCQSFSPWDSRILSSEGIKAKFDPFFETYFESVTEQPTQ